MVWQCVASSCNIFILTIRTTAVAQLQGHFKELLMTDSSAVGKKNKKNPYQQTAQASSINISQTSTRLRLPCHPDVWPCCLHCYDRMCWRFPTKGPKSQWAPWGLPNVWICCHPEDLKRNTCHTNKGTGLAWLVWCGDNVCPWPRHCCQIHRKGTYMSLQVMWLLYWRIGGMHSSSSGSCGQLELQHITLQCHIT